MLTMNEVVDFLKNPIVIGLMLVVFLMILMLIGRRIYLKKQLKKQFEQLEIKYNEIISVPLSFKINKSNSLIKINSELEKEVLEIRDEYDALNQLHSEIIAGMGDVEDLISYGNVGNAKASADALSTLIDDGLKRTHELDHRLNRVLEQETRQRVEITAKKDRFRKIKAQLMRNESLFADSFSILEAQTQEIEQRFSTFEEWMFASNFEKAQDLNSEISDEIDLYEFRIQTIPVLYEHAKGLVPSLLDVVSTSFQQARAAGVYLSHIEVPKNIGLISESLKEDLLRINHGDINDKQEHLDDLSKRLEQLNEQIEKEMKAHEEMVVSSRRIYENIDELKVSIKRLLSQKESISERFDIPKFELRIDSAHDRIHEIDEKRNHVVRMIEEEKIPATSIVIAIREMAQDLGLLQKDFEALDEEVAQANADELRAKQQLMKLYLIINDVQVRIKRRSLPLISEQYEQDVRNAKQYTRQIDELLKQNVLDIVRLNATVAEAIDFTYKLHNNVNNLVGVVDMCENAIVYANKYRAYIPNVDAELTRAELAFNNGEYTQSLKTIIQAIDRHRPNSSYEELIQKNAQSAK